MNSEESDAIIEIWAEPAAMDTGAPEPLLVREADRLWVAYRARDLGFPGYNHPSAAEYLAAHPGDPFAVLLFEGVSECRFGPPSNERLHEHPLYGRGLHFYQFHRVRYRGEAATLWIVTFHDQTLEVRGNTASAMAMRFVSGPEDAILLAKNGRRIH